MAAKAKPEKKSGVTARPYKTTILVTLSGTTPILFNPSTEELVSNLIAGHNPGKDTRPVEEQAKSKLLTNGKGQYIIPRSWVFACMRESGRNVPYKKEKDKITSGTQGTKLPSLLEIHHEGYVLHDGNGVPLTKFEVDCRKGNNANAGKGKGTAVGIVRPRFDPPWSIDVEMTIRTDRIGLERIMQLLEVGGEQYGLGDGRPGMGKLDFGMFKVTKVQVLKTHKAPPAVIIEGLEKMKVVESEEAVAVATA